MKIDIDKAVEIASEMNADSMKYELKYCTNGEVYAIKIVIERVDG